jgi:WD40 repeat protein
MGAYGGRTIESMVLTGTQESNRMETRPSTSSDRKEVTTIEDGKGKAVESSKLPRSQESSEDSSFAHQKEAKPIEINGLERIYSVSFLADGKHVVNGGDKGKMRRWRVEDGKEMGTPMVAGSDILNIAVSQDGKWVVSGTRSGLVTVWNAESYSKVTEWKAHNEGVRAVDVSPDGTKIATGSSDTTVCVWSLSTVKRLLHPFKHLNYVVAVKFSPNGRLIATATWNDVRVYDSQNGGLFVEFPVQVTSTLNQSLAWANDSKQLFALSRDGNAHCLDVSTRKTRSKWAVHSSDNARCIALASNGTFIAVSSTSSISFWDTATRERIGSVIERTQQIVCMAISTNYDLLIGGDKTITLFSLCDTLLSRYFDTVCVSACKGFVRDAVLITHHIVDVADPPQANKG